MLETLQRRRADIVAALGVVLGLSLLTTAQVSKAVLPFQQRLRGDDIQAWWTAATSLVHGDTLWPYHGIGDFFYPAPYVVLFAPLTLLPSWAAGEVARILTACGMAAVIAIWAWRGSHVDSMAWLLGLSLPVVAAVYLGQMSTTIGLLGFTIAVWAQRRGLWWVVGVAAAIGSIRLGNALPILTILIVGGWGRPRGLLVAALSGAAVLAPMAVICTLWFPGWAPDYIRFVSDYRWGLPYLMHQAVGPAGTPIVQMAACGVAFLIVRREAGQPLDLDRAAAVFALTMVVAPLTAAYAAAFGLPAVIRASMRPGLRLIVVVAVVVPWLTVLGLFDNPIWFNFLGPLLAAAVGLISIRPLLRRRRLQP